MQVAGTFSKGSLINASYVMALPDFAANVTSQLDAAILMTNAPASNPQQAKAAIEAALADYPNVTVNDPADITREGPALGRPAARASSPRCCSSPWSWRSSASSTPWSLSVVERTRELGLLRAVGGTRRQVRAVIRRESVLMSLLGALTGVALGTCLRHRAQPGAGRRRASPQSSVPTVTLVVYLLVAVAVGVLAAIGPARRASKVDVLRALTAE